MPCYHPISAYQLFALNPETGKSIVLFKEPKNKPSKKIKLPCNQCCGCRLERSRQWAVRCMHESTLHKQNCFITLTYSPENLPMDNSLSVSAFQKFMKRLRKKYGPNIRFYHCGEYGSKYGRPHYHAIIFGLDFSDKTLWRKTEQGHSVYRSKSLEELWPHGFSEIGDVTFQSAAYVARYIMKKITGDAAAEHYEYTNPITGQIFNRKPEYTTMSRRPGIAHGWFEKYSSDVYSSDCVLIKGKKFRPPKYYDGLYEISYPEDFSKIKAARKKAATLHVDNNTPDRLNVREQIQLSKLSRLKRTI